MVSGAVGLMVLSLCQIKPPALDRCVDRHCRQRRSKRSTISRALFAFAFRALRAG
jgi:hypothetical protein